ncbi:sigma-70 non-essential region-containing protein [Mucilaginibacter aquariorum]|uniref:Sigma-70 non-essential region-containing protein n=1 Tax=Mucilaginibacter aquariorum TaxID=2967225 RepID=A0ABT1SY27_9SPHI|nr:sigma-70 non-essential region-containing protein [Mucilaginibacter aquariorum]MCQ6957257.1 sigma-70 non-essential region-containing protein [Mucilaginibacter aquariorum]
MKQVVFLIICFYLASCEGGAGGKKSALDEFYTDKGSYDMARIPLIKPYEAVVPATGDHDWLIHSVTDSVLFTIPGVKGIKVLNDRVILAYGVNTLINYQDAGEGWFILIPRDNFIKIFTKHEEYINWLDCHGIKKEPSLYEPIRVYDYFKFHETVDWGKIDGNKWFFNL